MYKRHSVWWPISRETPKPSLGMASDADGAISRLPQEQLRLGVAATSSFSSTIPDLLRQPIFPVCL